MQDLRIGFWRGDFCDLLLVSLTSATEKYFWRRRSNRRILPPETTTAAVAIANTTTCEPIIIIDNRWNSLENRELMVNLYSKTQFLVAVFFFCIYRHNNKYLVCIFSQSNQIFLINIDFEIHIVIGQNF